MRRILFALSTAALALLPVAAGAACTGNTIFGCPAAVSPGSTDLLLGWQPGQNPHTRTFTLPQVLGAGLPGAFSTLGVSSTATVGPTGGNQLTVAGNPASGSQIVFSETGTGGYLVQNYFDVARTIAYSGVSTASTNHMIDVSGVISGTSADVGQYALNNYKGFLSLQTGQVLDWTSGQVILSAGFYGQAGAGLWNVSQTGAPGTLAAWVGNTAYSTLGQLVQNGTNEYELITSGTSAVSGGPTGTGTNITDGTAHWRYVNTVDLSYNMSGLVSQAIASFNAGGSANDYRGVVQGGNSVSEVLSGATDYLNVIGHEVDVGIAPGGSAYRRVALQLVSLTTAGKGDFQDAGLTFGGGASGRFENGINFADNAVSATGYGINFWSWNAATTQAMAGAIDMLRVNANGAGFAGGGFLVRWANGEITNPTAALSGGDLYMGYGALQVGSNGLTLDAPLYRLTGNPTGLTGGTNWSTGQLAVDNHGNRGTVTASAGVPTAVTITQFASSVAPYTSSTWSPDNASSNTGAGGSPVLSTTFTATEATAQATTPTITLGGVATVGFGSAMTLKNTVVASLPTCNAGAKYYEYVVSDGSAPTYGATIAGGGAVVAPVVCDGTNWKAH